MATTTMGTQAVRLTAAFLVLFLAWLLYVALTPMARPTFFSDPIHAVIILTAVACAVAGGAAGAFALLVRRDLSAGTILSILVGGFVLFWTIAEIKGH